MKDGVPMRDRVSVKSEGNAEAIVYCKSLHSIFAMAASATIRTLNRLAEVDRRVGRKCVPRCASGS
jgi:hypothetical protein